MLLRLLAFVFFVLALGAIAGDAWASYASGQPFALRGLGAWWMSVSPATLDMAQHAWPGIAPVLPYPAPAVLALLGVLTLLPTIFFRQKH